MKGVHSVHGPRPAGQGFHRGAGPCLQETNDYCDHKQKLCGPAWIFYGIEVHQEILQGILFTYIYNRKIRL